MPFEYNSTSVYFQNCKATRNLILFATSSFCFKVGMPNMFEYDLNIWPVWPNFDIWS